MKGRGKSSFNPLGDLLRWRRKSFKREIQSYSFGEYQDSMKPLKYFTWEILHKNYTIGRVQSSKGISCLKNKNTDFNFYKHFLY